MHGMEDGAADSEARNQLAGMAVMLTVTREYLPDEVLLDLVQRLGGPTAYVHGVLSIGFALPEFPQRERLLQGAQDVLVRLRHLRTSKAPS